MGRDAINISDEAIQKATGKTWSEWEALLDAEGAGGLSHKEIVALLHDGGYIESAWWQQAVTVGYEKLKGKRTLGQTKDTGFQVGVQRTVALPHDKVWRLLTAPEGVRAWLGGEADLAFEKGETYRLADGSEGEVRVIYPNDRLRITWQPKGWPRPSTIQIRVVPKGEKTTIVFHQEHLPGAREREARRAHFKAALDTLQDLIEPKWSSR